MSVGRALSLSLICLRTYVLGRLADSAALIRVHPWLIGVGGFAGKKRPCALGARSWFGWRRERRLGNGDFEGLGFCFGGLREMNLQGAVFELGFDFVRLGALGQEEGSFEAAVGPLDAVVAAVLFFFLEFALAGDAEGAVFDDHVDVFFFHLGQVGLDDEFFVVLGDVDERAPFGGADGFLAAPRDEGASAEEAVEAVAHGVRLADGTPGGE
jgi:hypothetical protein